MNTIQTQEPPAKEWQNQAAVLKDLLGFEFSPVAVNCLKEPFLKSFDKQVRICKGILDGGRGEVIQIGKENNACFGAGWHLGFHKPHDPRIPAMIKQFVVEGEKLFSSNEALDNLLGQMEEVPDNAHAYFLLGPLEKAELEPELVIFICDALAACRLLTLSMFDDGIMPKIKLGGPTCRLSVLYPLMTGQVNLSFFDYTARKLCKVEKDKLLISVPYPRIPKIVQSIDACSAGKAKVEFPREFQEFLQEKLIHKRRDQDGNE